MTTISTLDTHWTGRRKSIAAALLEMDGARAIIDPGPASTLAEVQRQLAERGIGVADLDAVLLTHIHLDHAAATGALVRENPRLQVYVHERGAPHMADPSKLIASARRLYGAELETLYGEFLPVPPENLQVLRGGEAVRLGGGEMQALYTPGHASHHVSYFEPKERVAFVGDTAGISVEGHSLILPATPPPDIDLALWNGSLDAILALKPARLFLTHFGYAHDPANHIERYRRRLDEWLELTRRLLLNSDSEEEAGRNFVAATAAEVRGTVSREHAEHYIFNGGLMLSYLGLARHIRKSRDGAKPKSS